MESKPQYPPHVTEIHNAIDGLISGGFKNYSHRVQPKSKSLCTLKLQQKLHTIEVFRDAKEGGFNKPVAIIYVGKDSAKEVPPDIRVLGNREDNEFAKHIGKEIKEMNPTVRWMPRI